ncbi:serine/threonine-protein kinase [Xanthomonas hortorum]|uniref:serine/threonine-protein kinase n=1 Tax=Xanthomonas hortorum TaxID=56454 RepID=UPI0020438141|nr:serine/threonine-protein kinase [Xanthomonas hortorum]MCM5686933.1 serine/threonine protein kinase [Xanthomonas hortorum pv. pelargonii]
MNGPLRADEIVGGRYRVTNYHAEGGMQFVYRATDTLTSRIVALKTPKNSSASKRFKRSAVVAAQVNHPNVAKTLDYVNEEGKEFLIEEFIEGQDLQKSLLNSCSNLDPYLTAKLFHHISKGVSAAHHAKVIHRDLKPTNIMIAGDFDLIEIKITDFGIAKMASDVLDEAAAGGPETMLLSNTAVGALPYMAPEAIETPKEITTKADIWSVGAMFFHISTGILPFGEGLKAVRKILEAVPEAVPDHATRNPQFAPLVTQILDLASSCLKLDPNERPTADQLVKSCGDLYYSLAHREHGKVTRVFDHKKFGFISSGKGPVFFHANSVYGTEPLIVGDQVCFTRHHVDGGAAPRAHPVLKMNN